MPSGIAIQKLLCIIWASSVILYLEQIRCIIFALHTSSTQSYHIHNPKVVRNALSKISQGVEPYLSSVLPFRHPQGFCDFASLLERLYESNSILRLWGHVTWSLLLDHIILKALIMNNCVFSTHMYNRIYFIISRSIHNRLFLHHVRELYYRRWSYLRNLVIIQKIS